MRLFRYNMIAIGVVSILMFPDKSVGKASQDWSRVQNLDVGVRIRISLHKNEAPRGMRRVRGRVVSASPDRVTIAASDGATRSFDMQGVRRVEITRNIRKRGGAWGLTGVAMVATIALSWFWPDFVVLGGDLHPMAARTLRGAAWFVAPTAAVTLLALPYKEIYRVPEKHRSQVSDDSSSIAAHDRRPR